MQRFDLAQGILGGVAVQRTAGTSRNMSQRGPVVEAALLGLVDDVTRRARTDKREVGQLEPRAPPQSCPSTGVRVMNKEVWSLFSGAMGLDLGLEQVGLGASIALDINKNCRSTIEKNRPGIKVHPEGDVSQHSGDSLRQFASFDHDVFIMAGGPPCQSFSTGGKRAGLQDPRGNLIYTYLNLIGQVRPQYFVLENVANLVTAALEHRPIKDRPGRHWSLSKYSGSNAPTEEGVEPLRPEELSGSAIRQILSDTAKLGYAVSFGVLNAAEHGAPQRRFRFVMIGARDSDVAPQMPVGEHGEGRKPIRTVRDAIGHLEANPGHHSVYTPKVAEVFAQVPEGGTWRDLPPNVAEAAMGKAYYSGGGKTGFFRRLAWDLPAPTVTGCVNRKASAMCHPAALRPISVREACALQGFPSDWEVTGSMSAQYLQAGNAVPVSVGRAVGEAILHHYSGKVTEGAASFEAQLQAASNKLRTSARNKRGRRKNDSSQAQTAMF